MGDALLLTFANGDMKMPFKNPEDKARYMKKHNAQPHERDRRADRNGARADEIKRLMEEEGMSRAEAVKHLKGKDVHHPNAKRPPSTDLGSTTVVISMHENRNPGFGKERGDAKRKAVKRKADKA